VLYQLLMLLLTILGVVGIVVCSYKMSRSRVYVVGVVHKLAPEGARVESAIEQQLVERELVGVQDTRTAPGPRTVSKRGGYEFLGKPEYLDIRSDTSLSISDVIDAAGARIEALKINVAELGESAAMGHYTLWLTARRTELRRVSKGLPASPAALVETKATGGTWGDYSRGEGSPRWFPRPGNA